MVGQWIHGMNKYCSLVFWRWIQNERDGYKPVQLSQPWKAAWSCKLQWFLASQMGKNQNTGSDQNLPCWYSASGCWPAVEGWKSACRAALMGNVLPAPFPQQLMLQGFSAVKVTSRVCGVAARNNLVSCSFFLNWFKWQRQLASFPFSLFLNLFFLQKLRGMEKIALGLSCPMWSLEATLASWICPWVCVIEASQVAPSFQFCAESCYVINSHNHEAAQECEARSELWLMLHRWHCNGEDTGIWHWKLLSSPLPLRETSLQLSVVFVSTSMLFLFPSHCIMWQLLCISSPFTYNLVLMCMSEF